MGQNIFVKSLNVVFAAICILNLYSAQPIDFHSECSELGFGNLKIEVKSVEGLENAAWYLYSKFSSHTENFKGVSMSGTINDFEFSTGKYNTLVVFEGYRAYKPRFGGDPSIKIFKNDALQKCISSAGGFLASIVQDYINGLPIPT